MHSDQLICLLELNLQAPITKVIGVSCGTPEDYATKSQNDTTINQILKTPYQSQMIGLISIFVHIQSLCLLLFYISPEQSP